MVAARRPAKHRPDLSGIRNIRGRARRKTQRRVDAQRRDNAGRQAAGGGRSGVDGERIAILAELAGRAEVGPVQSEQFLAQA
jgi:hypothetical protein